VDLKGLPLFVMVTPAGMHDSVAAREAFFRLRLMHPEITMVWADLAYADTHVAWARSFLHLTIKTVSRPKGAKGFVILPRRWVVERPPAWLSHARRNVRVYETRPEHSEAVLTLASITLMTGRLARPAVRPNASIPRSAEPVHAA
jgi:transposase